MTCKSNNIENPAIPQSSLQSTENTSNTTPGKEQFVLSDSVQPLENDGLFKLTTLVIDGNEKSKHPNLNTPLQLIPNTNNNVSQIHT